jgi:voltage-gated potassium channel
MSHNSEVRRANAEIRRRVGKVAGLMGAVMLVGTLGYHLIEGWSLFDALYMSVITLGTVGYGETHELSTPGRVFTIFLILFGISTLTYALSTLTAFIVEGELKDILRRKRMETRLAKLNEHYILCGAGHTGRSIMTELQKTHREFVLIEKDPVKVEKLQAKGVLAFEGDATDDQVLIKAGITRALGLFGALPSDRDNVFVAIGAKGLNPNLRVVCKQQDMGASEKLRRGGADVVVDPALIGGLRMASEMIRPAIVGFLDSMIRAEGKVFRIEEVHVSPTSPLKGKPLGAIKGAEGNAALILAVKHPHAKTYELNPNPSRKIEANEVLVAMGTLDHIKELQNQVSG